MLSEPQGVWVVAVEVREGGCDSQSEGLKRFGQKHWQSGKRGQVRYKDEQVEPERSRLQVDIQIKGEGWVKDETESKCLT